MLDSVYSRVLVHKGRDVAVVPLSAQCKQILTAHDGGGDVSMTEFRGALFSH